MLLVGDIGGTKTDLALLTSAGAPRSPVVRMRFRNADYPGLSAIAQAFLARAGVQVTRACFDVAGAVTDGRCQLTNLAWDLSARALQHELHIERVWLINDVAALAYAAPSLQPNELHTLHHGEPVAGAAVAVIAAGTGLGEAFAVRDGAAYRGYPSEGAHADFAPVTPLQIELLRYLQRRFAHVSFERVCSGLALPQVYEFFRDGGHAPESAELASRLAAASDRTPLIIAGAIGEAEPDALCAAALATFIDVLGAEAGNLALKVLATGGVFIGGGIAPRVLALLEDGRFLASFRRKGRFSDLLTRIPVHVIIADNAALIGAACYARTRMDARGVDADRGQAPVRPTP